MSDNKSVGLKIHDMHHGLVQSSGAIVESEYAFLKELGAAIQIATTIKDHETIADLKTLYAAAGELKISKQLADVGLDHLEKLGFVRLKRSTGRQGISRVDVIVPDPHKVYSSFGEYFLSENDSDVAKQTVDVLEKLSAFPHKEKEIISALGLSPSERDIIIDVGKKASLLDTYISPADSESILYSPLYWDDNPDKIFELLKTHKSDDFFKVIEEIKKYQGMPDGRVPDKIVDNAIQLGCLPTLSVNSTSGLRKFIFTPRTGVGKVEKQLLHKARVLISCVRYGENFAGITQILYPERLISVLVNRGFTKPHSEILKQYEPARNLGLLKIVPTSGGRFEAHFIDNDENRKVAQMALEMLKVGESSKFDSSEEMAKKILLPGSALHPTQTRTHILQEKNIQVTSTTSQRVNDLLRGID